MVVDVVPNRADVIRHLFREREGLAHQATTPLTQRVVEPLDMTGLTTLLTNGSVALGRQNRCVGLPEIGVTDRTFAIDRR